MHGVRRAGRLEVDHVNPMHRGGDPYDPANLQTLCAGSGGCHALEDPRREFQPASPWQRRMARVCGGYRYLLTAPASLRYWPAP